MPKSFRLWNLEKNEEKDIVLEEKKRVQKAPLAPHGVSELKNHFKEWTKFNKTLPRVAFQSRVGCEIRAATRGKTG